MSKRSIAVRLIIALLILSGIGLTVYRMFFIRMVGIPHGSMKNTVIPGDRLIINRAFGAIDRGRLVVFQYPNDSKYYLSRVIGLPGETIQMRGKVVYINEHPLNEQRVTAKEAGEYDSLVELSREGKGTYQVFYTRPRDYDHSGDNFPFAGDTSFRIPLKSYFVMSDNRDNAEDSRYRGAVPRELIWGNASVIYYSATIPDGEIRWERIFKKVH